MGRGKGTGRSKRRGSHNQDRLCKEKKLFKNRENREEGRERGKEERGNIKERQ